MDARAHFARGLDAGLNRLGEALRTVEDRLRFDHALPRMPSHWKELRGELLALRRAIEERWGPLASWRDVAGDPGSPLGEPATASPLAARSDPGDLLAANLARAREAARSVEEAVRGALPDLATAAERLRYRIYTAEAHAAGLLRRKDRLRAARLYVLLTPALTAGPFLDTARQVIRGGADMVQLRDKELPNRAFLELARELRELTAELGAILIINDRVDVAALVGADGVHQGQDDLPVAAARRLLGADAIIGVSTHAPEQARKAGDQGADYIGVGPIFPTRTKEHREAVGLEYIAGARAATSVPGFAIGSVNRETLPRVIAAGARRVAVCTGIIAEPDPAGTTRWFREQLDRAWETETHG